MSMRQSFTAILLMMTAVGLNAATYYKWTDSNGVPHYSQYAPTNGIDLKKVLDGAVTPTADQAKFLASNDIATSYPVFAGFQIQIKYYQFELSNNEEASNLTGQHSYKQVLSYNGTRIVCGR